MRQREGESVCPSATGEKGREKNLQADPLVSGEPHTGLHPATREIMTWAESKSLTLNQLSHQGAPHHLFLRTWGLGWVNEISIFTPQAK